MSRLSEAIDKVLFITKGVEFDILKCDHRLVSGIGYKVCPACLQRLDGKKMPKNKQIIRPKFFLGGVKPKKGSAR
jgi:hypothetical protein